MNSPDPAALVTEFPRSAPGSPADIIPIVGKMGLEVLHAERGRCVLRLPFEPNINHVNMIYAGSMFTLAEMPGGVLFTAAFDTSRFAPVVGEMKVRFAKPAMSALLVDARMSDEEIERVAAELDENGRARWELDQDIVDESGTVVASASAVYFGMAYPR
ncbi:MAG: PaaI family thioesterase [Acidimicrobiales bacterium]|nr:PaaI family thioesterase [Acidimicrobiales bacterium]